MVARLRVVCQGCRRWHRASVRTQQGSGVPAGDPCWQVATGLLYFFLPLAYLADVAFDDWPWLHTVAIAGATFCAVLYWAAGIGYIKDVRQRAAHPVDQAEPA